VLGPIFVLKLKWKPRGFARKMVAEMWLYPDGARIFELSTRCLPSEAFQVAAEVRVFLNEHGIDLSGEQQTKTHTALEFFAAELAAGGAQSCVPSESGWRASRPASAMNVLPSWAHWESGRRSGAPDGGHGRGGCAHRSQRAASNAERRSPNASGRPMRRPQQPESESARRRSGPSRPRRTSPTARIKTASLNAALGEGAERRLRAAVGVSLSDQIAERVVPSAAARQGAPSTTFVAVGLNAAPRRRRGLCSTSPRSGCERSRQPSQQGAECRRRSTPGKPLAWTGESEEAHGGLGRMAPVPHDVNEIRHCGAFACLREIARAPMQQCRPGQP
jgi:hypothetical protein